MSNFLLFRQHYHTIEKDQQNYTPFAESVFRSMKQKKKNGIKVVDNNKAELLLHIFSIFRPGPEADITFLAHPK